MLLDDNIAAVQQMIAQRAASHQAAIASNAANDTTFDQLLSAAQKASAPVAPMPGVGQAGAAPVAAIQRRLGGGYTGPMAGNADVQHVDPVLRNAVQQLIAASGGKIGINSGYRDYADQAAKFQAALQKYGSAQTAGKWVAPPGHSNHNKGEAIDLRLGDPNLVNFAHQNAAKYGLKFPMPWENWHVERA